MMQSKLTLKLENVSSRYKNAKKFWLHHTLKTEVPNSLKMSDKFVPFSIDILKTNYCVILTFHTSLPNTYYNIDVHMVFGLGP